MASGSSVLSSVFTMYGQYDLPACSIDRITSHQPTILACPLGGARAFWASIYSSVSFHPYLPGAFSHRGRDPAASATTPRGAGLFRFADDRLLKTSKHLGPEWKRTSRRPEPQTEIHRMYFICTGELNMQCQINQQLRGRGGRLALR